MLEVLSSPKIDKPLVTRKLVGLLTSKFPSSLSPPITISPLVAVKLVGLLATAELVKEDIAPLGILIDVALILTGPLPACPVVRMDSGFPRLSFLNPVAAKLPAA